MEDFLKWVRNRFTMVDLMHLADDEDETLKLLMFENGPSRDEFIKLLVYKLLLESDSESKDSKVHSNIKFLMNIQGIINVLFVL